MTWKTSNYKLYYTDDSSIDLYSILLINNKEDFKLNLWTNTLRICIDDIMNDFLKILPYKKSIVDKRLTYFIKLSKNKTGVLLSIFYWDNKKWDNFYMKIIDFYSIRVQDISFLEIPKSPIDTFDQIDIKQKVLTNSLISVEKKETLTTDQQYILICDRIIQRLGINKEFLDEKIEENIQYYDNLITKLASVMMLCRDKNIDISDIV